jgi:hypothetical protein
VSLHRESCSWIWYDNFVHGHCWHLVLSVSPQYFLLILLYDNKYLISLRTCYHRTRWINRHQRVSCAYGYLVFFCQYNYLEIRRWFPDGLVSTEFVLCWDVGTPTYSLIWEYLYDHAPSRHESEAWLLFLCEKRPGTCSRKNLGVSHARRLLVPTLIISCG